jgi:hypothetical protein
MVSEEPLCGYITNKSLLLLLLLLCVKCWNDQLQMDVMLLGRGFVITYAGAFIFGIFRKVSAVCEIIVCAGNLFRHGI